jgi:hypothetical protein
MLMRGDENEGPERPLSVPVELWLGAVLLEKMPDGDAAPMPWLEVGVLCCAEAESPTSSTWRRFINRANISAIPARAPHRMAEALVKQLRLGGGSGRHAWTWWNGRPRL